uniref:Enoyl-CoA hydratase n=1 Tax=Plectus sambesii TaxID=2011161 RepID=A0A914VAG8_9BILA
AVAGGLELALMCDMRVADESAKFGVFCRRFGVPLIDGGTVRLPKLIGLSRAMDMILTGREVDAKTAFDWGLVNRLTPDGTSLKVAIELANTLAAFPQACMNADKRSSYYAAYDASSHQDAFDYELRQGRDVLLEAQKGAKKFTDGKGKHGSFDSWTKPSKL